MQELKKKAIKKVDGAYYDRSRNTFVVNIRSFNRNMYEHLKVLPIPIIVKNAKEDKELFKVVSTDKVRGGEF